MGGPVPFTILNHGKASIRAVPLRQATERQRDSICSTLNERRGDRAVCADQSQLDKEADQQVRQSSGNTLRRDALRLGQAIFTVC